LKEVSHLISQFPAKFHENLVDLSSENRKITVSGVGNFSSKSFVLADLLRSKNFLRSALWVVGSDEEKELVMKNLPFWSDIPVFHYEQKVSSLGALTPADLRENRIKSLELVSLITSQGKKLITLNYKHFFDELPALSEINEKSIHIKKNDDLSPVELIEALIAKGYELCEDRILIKGSYNKSGSTINVFPANTLHPIRIDLDFDQVAQILSFDVFSGETLEQFKELTIYPISDWQKTSSLFGLLSENDLVIEDELDIDDIFYDDWNQATDKLYEKVPSVLMTAFNDDAKNHEHFHYLSVLSFRSAYDLLNDLREKVRHDWQVLILSKNCTELSNIFTENNLAFQTEFKLSHKKKAQISLIELPKEQVFPQAFQNPDTRIAVFTDRDISSFKEESKKSFNRKVYLDFITGLKEGDFVVHSDHGVAIFMGLDQKTIDGVTREYLKLGYAENDKLYVPIDQADKVNKYIGAPDTMPKLTRLGSAEWITVQSKVKKEAEKLAKELLEIYARRKQAKGHTYPKDNRDQSAFDESFPYEVTPGQLKAINDVKVDMEKAAPMDRLVCGDVGFGKTEVAMRAAFKAVKSGKQVAVISPITILADQHYRSFSERMEQFDVRVEMISRFRTKSEQEKILKKLKNGEIDVIIGTHRLLQKDVEFKKLGLLIIDEEQRFGVKQKEHFKSIRAEVDILTLTATPIPRTLNICLNKLRDVSIIGTPPPGRLPVITEVRRFSNGLIRDAIMNELERGGQIYFLHNRVQTIDSMAQKLRILVPEARFGVAHGQLGSGDLEERIMAFKDHKFDVLVSSTIIENGIDLSNANTLIVNNAEKFGLAQLYQLRGRVGRSKTQAYAYFMYQGQRLKLDAKKRLRAIVEASELGSGFQIAMRDLEIRGVGDILGASQHGTMNVVGVSHFIRMLNKAVDDLESGRNIKEGEKEPEVSIELPLTSFIPDSFIPNSKDKINAYQRLASADNLKYLKELHEDLITEYGKMPKEVSNLFRILELKLESKAAGIVNIKAEKSFGSNDSEILMTMSDRVKPANIMALLEYNHKWVISGTKLKIKLSELSVNWFDDLLLNVRHLQKKLR
jgi:transcription-repair coupling factor (superfamily II helicase)